MKSNNSFESYCKSYLYFLKSFLDMAFMPRKICTLDFLCDLPFDAFFTTLIYWRAMTAVATALVDILMFWIYS